MSGFEKCDGHVCLYSGDYLYMLMVGVVTGVLIGVIIWWWRRYR